MIRWLRNRRFLRNHTRECARTLGSLGGKARAAKERALVAATTRKLCEELKLPIPDVFR